MVQSFRTVFLRAARLRREEGFTIVELMVAMLILFIAIITTAYTATLGFKYAALARQRQAANSQATQAMEEIRALAFATVSAGLSTSDVTATSGGDSFISSSGCPAGYTKCITVPGTSTKEGLVTGTTN